MMMRTKTIETVYRYQDYETAYNTLNEALLQKVAYSALIGESGVGKTTVLRELKPQVEKSGGIVVYSSLANNSSYGLLQMISDTLHLSARRSKQETVKMIVQTLSIMSSHLYVWLDEAQSINDALYHEVKMLCEASLEKSSLFSVLFIGQIELLEKLRAPALYSVMRRINPIVEITGLLRDEIVPFVIECFSEESMKRFDSESIAFLFEQSVGNPSKVIRIAEKCLGNGNKEGKLITKEIISRCIDRYFM